MEEVKDHLRQMYDGYHFSKEMAVDIYNPFSLLNALSSGNIDNYWFSTGTPTFLVKLLRAGNYNLQSFSTAELTTRTLASKESIYDEYEKGGTVSLQILSFYDFHFMEKCIFAA